MKLALLGDIHGNELALQAVLRAASAEGVEQLLVTGDLVGYYFHPAAVLAQLGAWKKHVVRGNHEDMLCEARQDRARLAAIEAKYGTGHRVALEELTPAQIDELCGLPHPLELQLGGRRILLCHGAPWDNDFYVYPDAPVEVLERCAHSRADIVILGHTHYPMVRAVHGTQVVNPGSVGQPRNRQPGAQWALYNCETNELTLKREDYDFAAVAAESRVRHPDVPFLSAVLERT
jgi:putative phosphoesterase